MASESHELTEAEWRAVTAMRTAHAIIGGDSPAPYDIVGMANEILNLRDENERLKGELRAALDPCACVAYCGDSDPDGPGVCKSLPRRHEPLVEIVLVPRRGSGQAQPKAEET